MTDRFLTVAPLPASSGRARLALDTAGGAPRPVLLEILPLAVSGDPDHLARLAAEAEAAARLFHPNVLAPIGLETIGDELVLVRHWRDGVTLRAFLEAGGRLPPEFAARIGREACAALAHAHGRSGPEGRALVHGILAPERILIAADGGVLVGGFGAPPPGAQPPDDVRALGAILYEALTGEPPGTPPAPLESPGVPGPLAAAVDRAIAGGFTTPEAFASALLETAAPADAEALAAYAEAMVPPDEGDRAERRKLLEAALASARAPSPEAPATTSADAAVAEAGHDAEEISEEFIVGEPTPAPVERPPALLPEVAQTVAMPVPAGRGSGIPIAVAIIAAAAGFGIGFTVARGPGAFRSIWRATASLVPTTSTSTSTQTQTQTQTATSSTPKSTPPPPPAAAPPAPPKPTGKPSISVTAEPAGDIYVDGKKVGRAPITVPVARAVHVVRLREARLGVDASRKVDVKGPATPVRFQLGKGLLEVIAPDAAEVYLDGRRIGRGSLKQDLWEGEHRVEVRLGPAKTGERFRVEPNESFKYEVTPTP